MYKNFMQSIRDLYIFLADWGNRQILTEIVHFVCLTFQPDSLYNAGMRPLLYSDKSAAEKKIGWMRTGEEIRYYRNNVT